MKPENVNKNHNLIHTYSEQCSVITNFHKDGEIVTTLIRVKIDFKHFLLTYIHVVVNIM